MHQDCEARPVLSLDALGSLRGEIRHIEPNSVLSIQALRESANPGFPAAEYAMALHAQSEEKREEALKWARCSAIQGNPQAVHGVGRAYLAGWVSAKNEELGNKWLEKSGKQGFMPGEYNQPGQVVRAGALGAGFLRLL